MFRKTKPVGFRKWLTLENLKSSILEAAGDGSFPDKVYSYLSAALEVPIEKLERESWESTVLTLLKNQSKPIDVPILKNAPTNLKPVDWEYEGRTWFYYAHILSSAYGWSLEYIAELDPAEAMSLIQEIFTDDQLEKEFNYSLSELAYQYDKNTKKSNFKPMKRPYWMRPLAPTEVKKVRIRRDMLPQGRIIDMSGMPPQYQIPGLEVERK